jgi:putative FmdB family regulatory protein
MPIYEYDCDDCGRRFEALVRASTTPACPQCGSTDLHKRLSVPAPPVAGATAAEVALPGPCGACGHPDGPGACALR